MNEINDLSVVVGRMEGKLDQALMNHEKEITVQRAQINELFSKTNQLSISSTGHEARIKVVEEKTTGVWGKVSSVILPLVALGSLAVAIVSSL